jgi:hypothetical protein
MILLQQYFDEHGRHCAEFVWRNKLGASLPADTDPRGSKFGGLYQPLAVLILSQP